MRIAFQRQQLLRELASNVRYTYFGCFAANVGQPNAGIAPYTPSTEVRTSSPALVIL